VGLRDEAMALAGQARLERQVVLDDAGVDDDDPARAVLVRMGVLFAGPAVGRPARVAEAEGPAERLPCERALQVLELALRTAALERAVAHHRDPRRVVAAVLETAQPFQ